MYYLIGVNHDAQVHRPGTTLNEHHLALQSELTKAIERYRPSLIAVEESKDTLVGKDFIYESIPCTVARRFEIETRLCEPIEQERLALGLRDPWVVEDLIKTADFDNEIPECKHKVVAQAVATQLYFPLREQWWIDRLSDHRHSEVIFICGENHIETFSKRLESTGIAVQVIARDVGVNEDIKNRSDEAKRYPLENPELFAKCLRYFQERLNAPSSSCD